MEFLNPTALFGLLALPLLLIPYLIRRKPRRLVFSSLLLFLESGAQASGRPLGRINLPPIFFLQLLLLFLLVAALSEPVFSVRPTNVAVIVDNSASMQALEDGTTRFALAKEKLGAVLDELGTAGQVDVYLTTPRLAKLNATVLTPAQALGLVKNLQTYDVGDAVIDYDQAFSQLAQEQRYERIYFLTDHPATGQTAAARVISVGQPKGNLAVTGFDIRRGSLLDARMQASVVVVNFSTREEKVKVSLKAGGATLATRDLAVAAEKSVTATFDGFAERPAYEAEIDTRDALPLDNHRFAVAPGSRNLRILVITPRPKAAASLKSIQGVNVDVISPAEYGKTDRTGYGLEIFHFSSPEQLPENPALFILPPESSSLVDLGPPTANVQVSSWREAHGLTRYVNFSLFRPTYSRPLKPQTAGQVIIESPDGALAFAVEQRGIRYLTLGFDPLPYLGRENLPMSVFTLNVLDWFLESGGARSQATGEPIPLSSIDSGDSLTTPAGETVTLKRGSVYFSATFHQGVYRRLHGSASEYFARNLDDLGESDLRTSAPVRLRGHSGNGASTSVLFSFWPYLLLASFLLLLVEWFVFPRWSTPRLGLASGGFRRGWRQLMSR
jgi:aerotolerance regulator-like protein